MKIIMIGHGMVGHKFIESVLEHVGDDVEITILAEEPRLASVGDAHAMTPNALSYFYADEDTQVYKKIVVNGEKTKLLGAVLVGCAKEYNDLLQMMLNGLALPENPESLIMPGYAQSSAKSGGSGVDLLPDSATICSCNNVSKADICSAIASVLGRIWPRTSAN
jgi:nitrite reductase (NADH) large subunit